MGETKSFEIRRYSIRVKYGDADKEEVFEFVHKSYIEAMLGNISREEIMSEAEQDAAFNNAVQEINYIYKTFGRFATGVGVTNLFAKYGFERSPR